MKNMKLIKLQEYSLRMRFRGRRVRKPSKNIFKDTSDFIKKSLKKSTIELGLKNCIIKPKN